MLAAKEGFEKSSKALALTVAGEALRNTLKLAESNTFQLKCRDFFDFAMSCPGKCAYTYTCLHLQT